MDLSRRLAILALFLAWPGDALGQKPARKPTVHTITPGPKAEEETLRVLNDRVRPGDTIEFGEGTFSFTQELTLRTNRVTIRGRGVDKTILSFQKQNQGKQGILVNRDGFALEDLTIEDTKGDGVKVEGASGVTFRRVRARWTGKPKASNGAYGIYPVQCKGVLVEDCEAYGASDAGIYVGQSETIIVRRCRAERNVAGIEIENSTDADVYDNVATNNSGGLLIFDLPDLPVKNGKRIRAFRNKVLSNNHPNFATPGTMVSTISPGTGLIVLCSDQVEVFKNEIKGNNTFNLAVISYLITGREYKDKEFDPIPEGVYIHDNTFADGGRKPTGPRGELFGALLGTPVPDMVWDGVMNRGKFKDGTPPPAQRVVFRNNGEATFANLNWEVLGPRMAAAKSNKERLEAIAAHREKVGRDLKAHTGELKPLPEVKLPGGK
jgi:parallel beta-helix repeat protein